MTFLSLCSGIEAASLAWLPLGWRPVAVAEIDAFPSAVLAQRHPSAPNLGDMTKVKPDEIRADVVVAGTPCQSFSVAGLRKGLADPRGNLAFDLLRIVDGVRPKWLVWENVPGVLSSWTDEATFAASEESRRLLEADGLDPDDFEEVEQTNDFDQFTSAIRELGYSLAWGILDAQYFGLAQRRERVFVVASAGNGDDPAAVLFDRESVSGNPAPSREAGARVAGCFTAGAHPGGYNGQDAYTNSLIANCLDQHMGSGGPDDNAAQANHLVAAPITSGYAKGPAVNDGPKGSPQNLIVTHSLRADGFDASEDGTGRGTPIVPVSFDWQSGGSHPTRPPTMNLIVNKTNALASTRTPAVAIPILEVSKGTTSRGEGPNGCGIGESGDPMFTLQAAAQHAIAFQERGRDGGRSVESQDDIAYSLNAPNGGGRRQELNVSTGMAVRRLTPRECERLQGFPDDYTLIAYRGKPAADGPRYRALGNSMAVPVMAWIGQRIQQVHNNNPPPHSPTLGAGQTTGAAKGAE